MIEAFAANITAFCQTLSLARLANWFPESRRSSFMEWYVVSFAVILTILINLSSPGAWAYGIVAAYRVFDIVSYRLHYLLVKSRTTPWKRSSFRRSLLIVWINVYELVLAFGTIYLCTGHIMQGRTVLADPMSAAYFSAITMTTVGYGEFVPTDTFTRAIVCTQLASEVVILTFVVPALLALFGPASDEMRPSSGKGEATLNA